MSDADLRTLLATDTTTLAKWHCGINCHGWPSELEPLEGTYDQKQKRALDVMNWIKDWIGERTCHREWCNHLTDDEFDLLWRSIHDKCKITDEECDAMLARYDEVAGNRWLPNQAPSPDSWNR